MIDKTNINLVGEIEVSSLKNNETELLFKDKNQIEPGAIKIITRSLTSLDFDKSVSEIIAEGDFGTSNAQITLVNYPADNQIEFIAIFEEFSFEGTVTDLKLKSTALNEIFSSKTGLNIVKDTEMRLRVKWLITIN